MKIRTKPWEVTAERGSALAASLIVVMIIASLGAGLIQLHGAVARRQMQSIDNKRALYIAEAGLSEAFMAITHGKSGNLGTEEDPALFGNGVFWVEAVEQPDETVAIVSNGLCETGRFSLAMVVRRQISPVASLGAFGGQSVTVGTGAVIDGYDSRIGSYNSQVNHNLPQGTTGSGAVITSNGDITANGSGGGGLVHGIGLDGGGLGGGGDSTWIYGDVTPGPKNSVVADPDVMISGQTAPALRAATLEKIEPPETLGTVTSISQAGRTPMVLSNTEGRYRKIHVGRGSELVLEGPTSLLAGTLEMEPGAKLTIDTTNGPVMMYLAVAVKMQAGSVLENVSQDPTQFAMVVGGDGAADIDGDGLDDAALALEASGDFYGMLYAPRSDVTVPSDLRMFGCVTGKTVHFGQNARFTYDVAMASSGVAVTGLPGLLSWRIVELPDAPMVKRRVDPIRWMHLQGRTPVPSHRAHHESHLHLDYLDGAGVRQTYDGLEDAFDWTNVQEVEEMRWANDLAGLAGAQPAMGNGGNMNAVDLQQF